MQSQIKSNLFSAVLFVAILTVSAVQLQAEDKEWTVYHDNIPEEIRRISIPLEFNQTNSYFHSSSSSRIKSELIEQNTDTKFKHQIRLGKVADGYDYSVLVRDASDLKILNKDSNAVFEAKILRKGNDEKEAETVMEGYLFSQRSVTIPFEATSQQINLPSEKPIKGTFEIRISSNSASSFEASFSTSIKGRLAGKTSIDNVFLKASITSRNVLDIQQGELNLSLKPFDDRMLATSSNSKLPDTLSLGSCKLVVEKIASDNSELVLAILHGELLQEKKALKEQNRTIETGEPFPDFARVELVKRDLMTLGDLKNEAGNDGYVVLIFADFKKDMPDHYGGRPGTGSLTLSESMVLKILTKDIEKELVVGFVCQQLSLSTLYEKWLGNTPEFYVLSDFSNPMNMRFQMANMERPYYGHQPNNESLRGQLRFSEGTTVIALIDGNGDLAYINHDAGKELSGTLVHVNKLIKEGKTPEEKE